MVEPFVYAALPAKVVFGFGTLACVPDEVHALGSKRAPEPAAASVPREGAPAHFCPRCGEASFVKVMLRVVRRIFPAPHWRQRRDPWREFMEIKQTVPAAVLRGELSTEHLSGVTHEDCERFSHDCFVLAPPRT